LRSRRLAAAAALSAVLAGTVACSGPTNAPALVFRLDDSPPTPGTLDARVSMAMRADDFSFGPDSFLCSAAPVRITSVDLYRPSNGIRLVRWGFANHPYPLRAEQAGPLSNYGPFTSHAVTARCHHTSWYARLGLEVQRTHTGRQTVLGIRLTYRSGGTEKVGYISEQFTFREPGGKSPSGG
jgi:hypothetical protein